MLLFYFLGSILSVSYFFYISFKDELNMEDDFFLVFLVFILSYLAIPVIAIPKYMNTKKLF